MPTRNGKIANLPNALREQLNLRLLEGETGRELAVWLNALPEVQSILASQYNSAPISEVNLTHWRQGGYLQWRTEYECFDTARALAEGDDHFAGTGLSAQRLLNVLTLRFGQILMSWDTVTDEHASREAAFAQIAKKARILQGISRSVLAIHRLQSQSALKKSDTTTGSPASHSRPEDSHRIGEPCQAGAAQRPGGPSNRPSGPCHAEAAQRPGGPSHAEAAQRVGGLSLATSSKNPKILSGPITPSNLPHTPFNPGHDLEEVLNAIGA